MWIAIKLLNFQVKQDSLYLERMIQTSHITGDMIDMLLDFVVSSPVHKDEFDPLRLREILKLLRVFKSTTLEKVNDFFEDFFGLITALRLSRESLKKLLLENSENREILKKWALIAKKGKEFYESDEAKFIHALFHKCLIEPLENKAEDVLTVKLIFEFVDFLTFFLSGEYDPSMR